MCSRCIGRVLVVELGKLQWGWPSFFAVLLTLSWRLLSIPLWVVSSTRKRCVMRTRFVVLGFQRKYPRLEDGIHLWARIDYQSLQPLFFLCLPITVPQQLDWS